MTPVAAAPAQTSIGELLARHHDEPPSTEDVLAAVLPLLQQVAEIHAGGLVAPLEGIDDIHVTGGRLWFENAKAAPPRLAMAKVDALARSARGKGLEVVGRYRRVDDDGELMAEDLRIGRRDEPPQQPVYLPGFIGWEHALGHHDPLTDIFVLGLVLAAVATGLDLRDESHLRRLVAVREDLRALNPRLHPVAALVISRMLELDRHRRQQDLAGAIVALVRRREQDASAAFDLSRFRGFVASAAPDRREAILSTLQSRLYDRSRRNRLLHFRTTAASLNLTVASVPLVLDAANIDPAALATWGGPFAEQLTTQKPVALSRWLRFEDYPFITPALDRIRLDAGRDVAEYGFSQLRLVVCFLHWHDLKNAPDERVSSPLVLLPVRLARKKGVRDAYTLEATSDLAEINPVVRHHLQQLYGLVLPESLDLGEPDALGELHRALAEQIVATEPGVVLETVERARIDLVQAIARRRLELHVRRARLSGRGVRNLRGFDYAYGKDRRAPLGIQLFSNVVSPSPAPQRELLEEPRPRIFRIGPEIEVEKQHYELLDAADARTPFRWAFDLCSVTLANFNYRKMSLVGDYNAMLREPRDPKIFDQLFPREARPLMPTVTAPPIEERFAVVDGDPTQHHAIAVARTGASFIIQGPPGTGKSQTIANLIADHVARGKRVLFVCEKRAAIDVVYHRLQQQGLGRLCCVIHDSQADKKAFVLGLKEGYESWIDAAPQPEADQIRTATLGKLRDHHARIEHFSIAMKAPAAGAVAPLVEILRRCIALGAAPALTDDEWAVVPEHGVFASHAEACARIAADLRRIGAEPVLARHAARLLRASALDGPRALDAARASLRSIRGELAAQANSGELLQVTTERASLARSVLPLARAKLLGLLDASSDLTRRLRSGVAEVRRRAHRALEAAADARGWREPLARDEAEVALTQARRTEGSFLRFLFPTFWRLRRLMKQRFDLATWTVRPSWVQVLERLVGRHAAERALEEQQRLLTDESGAEDCVALFELAERFHTDLTPAQRRLRDELLASTGHRGEDLEDLARFADTAERIDGVLAGWRRLAPDALRTELERIDAAFERLPDILPVLRQVEALPEALDAAMRTLPLEPGALEAAVAHKAVRASPGARRDDLDGAALDALQTELAADHAQLRRANAASVVERARARFLEAVRISTTPAAGLREAEKAVKKAYVAGRRELEHEFGKVMRYRPIRDLVSGAPGIVVRDLKPVWLMSPLSVADTLPLTADFDVVVVDEASQIPLEDAIPALERGRQVIIVGDDKQLPPSSFFASNGGDDGAEPDEDVLALDADSLLDHAARALPSTMLGWHYRSRDELLIAFCNQAFYDGRLVTAPSVQGLPALGEVAAHGTAEAEAGARGLLDRSLSFHRMHGAVYAQRCNTVEAEYIAGLVRSLLAAGTGLSVGIVAFSEAQQGEIEAAIRRLADSDAAFRTRYEAEVEREDDGQFNGLFVKNLENVQGDERDVIILSVCYGPDAQGKMLMNFGPINQRGGERRLNVIFSRARKHMAVVSSIDWTHISNDYNDGAACLKSYLRYAAAASRGDRTEALAVLDGLARTRGQPPAPPRPDPVALELAVALRERGWEVDLDVGASRFRCDVAIRDQTSSRYRLGILIDTDGHHANDDLDDRYRLKPGLLRAFGWNVTWVLTRDWFLDRQAVMRRIESALATG